MRKELGIKIKQVNDGLLHRANGHLQELDLTASQLNVLIALMVSERHQSTMKELEKSQQVSQPTMVGLVSRLEEKGFLKSWMDPVKKRVKWVRLTQKAEETCLRGRENMDQIENAYFGALTEEEQTQLGGLLDKLIHSELAEKQG